VHELRWGKTDVTLEFVDTLKASGHRPTTVADVPAAPGVRVPAFFIEGGTAYFVWVFGEKYAKSWNLPEKVFAVDLKSGKEGRKKTTRKPEKLLPNRASA